MHRWAVIAASVLWLIMGKRCAAQEGLSAIGKVPIAFGLFSAPGDTAVQDTLTLYVAAQVARGRGRFGTVHISIPQGLTLVSGDTVFTAALSGGGPPYRFSVRPDHPGVYEVRGVMNVVRAPGESDFSEVSLSVVVEGRTLRPMSNTIHRLETTRGGRRFRLAGPWLVPMDDRDTFDNVDFEHAGVSARVVQGPSAVCPGCREGVTVAFVVVVDKMGRVIQAEAEGQQDQMPQSVKAIEAARAVLSAWRFEPARIKGKATNDWCRVSVPVTAR